MSDIIEFSLKAFPFESFAESAPKPPKAIAVIGANFGDEGKGATVNQLVSGFRKEKQRIATVVRFNGGPQAGHTVEAKVNGKMHRRVFSSLASGSLQGVETYLDQQTLVEPKSFMTEYQDLVLKADSWPTVMIHEDAMIITPFDVCLNQVQETLRGGEAHGSCGHGIGTTMERNLAGVDLSFLDFDRKSSHDLINLLDGIRERVLVKVRKLEIQDSSYLDRVVKFLKDDSVVERFLNLRSGFTNMRQNLHLGIADKIQAREEEVVIYEGAQGLLLDQDNQEYFPHVTHSKTGSHNILESVKENGLELSEVHYVTRPYLTRHGNGPWGKAAVSEANSQNWGARIEDKTNVHNQFQGSLRFARMTVDTLRARILTDFQNVKEVFPNCKIKLAVSCLDHLEIAHGEGFYTPKEYLDELSDQTGIECYPVYGTFEARKAAGLEYDW